MARGDQVGITNGMITEFFKTKQWNFQVEDTPKIVSCQYVPLKPDKVFQLLEFHKGWNCEKTVSKAESFSTMLFLPAL